MRHAKEAFTILRIHGLQCTQRLRRMLKCASDACGNSCQGVSRRRCALYAWTVKTSTARTRQSFRWGNLVLSRLRGSICEIHSIIGMVLLHDQDAAVVLTAR